MSVGTCGIAAAFLAILFVAGRYYRRSRERIPHLTLNLSVTREPASELQDTVTLTLEAKNTGSAPCEIGSIRWSASALSP